MYSLGMDIGGTNSVFGIVSEDGRIVKSGSVKTKAYNDFLDYVEAVCDGIRPLVEEVGGFANIGSFGIGAPNGNFYNGTIELAPNLPWKGILPLAQAFRERLGVPVAVTNDANAAAVGEMTYGAARGMRHFIEITLGTGVGSGIIIDGKLVYGHDGFAGELGHVVVERGGRSCGCGNKGCLETYCSATGVARTAKERLETSKEDSLLRAITDRPIESRDVYDAAVKGDRIALEIFEYTGRILGEALANFVAFSAPEAIVLFGGLTKAGDYIMNPVRRAMEDNINVLWRGKVKLLISQLKEADAAVLGAAAVGQSTCRS
ncbi:MAG: ROK family protein [Bacteroidaceae bacterium]|nr:ROK family protein [Bacteroidaceae bacterium]